MEVKIVKEDDRQVVYITGRVDTVTAPELEKAVAPLLGETGIKIVFDCTGLVYVSSSGLRVVLGSHKIVVAKGGKFALRGLSREVKSVFDLTGFSKILTIE
jgi:anti-anti-sigma factor